VGKASAAARNFLRVPSVPREPMAMALTQAPRTGALVPMGAVQQEILKALLHSACAGYGHRSPNPNGASARGGLEKRRAYPLPVAKPGVCHNLTRGMAGGFTAIQRLEFYSHSYQQLNIVLKHRSGSHCYRVS
jgi:hypothetical protein